MLSQALEAAMLLCFGLSWPTNAYKNYQARTAAGTSWQFIMLITVGYFAGIAAKICSGQINWVLAIYFLNLVFLTANWAVYFRNRKLDKEHIAEQMLNNDIHERLAKRDSLKTRIFATDGSEPSLNAIKYAAHSIDLDKATDIEVLAVAAPDNKASALRADNAVVHACEIMKGIGIDAIPKTRMGDPAVEIVREARESDAELVIMGSRGLSGLKQVVMGSVSHKVSENAGCPVLIVR